MVFFNFSIWASIALALLQLKAMLIKKINQQNSSDFSR